MPVVFPPPLQGNRGAVGAAGRPGSQGPPVSCDILLFGIACVGNVRETIRDYFKISRGELMSLVYQASTTNLGLDSLTYHAPKTPIEHTSSLF